MVFPMGRKNIYRAAAASIFASAIFLAGCSTTETRIADHPEIYQRLSAQDQALVSQGKIREGMSENAVWLAWGAPDQKAAGTARGRAVETWIYNEYTYSSAPYPFPYGPYGYGGYFGTGAVAFHHHHGHRFVVLGDPFYDPFFYSYIPPRVAYPAKMVTFSNGRAVSIQILSQPRGY